ncbi:XRE family transcriptional regulator [Polaribacter reichenbachii]|uniref:XRE family transcriptional regulator n=1 Tax=Polaribacter reichenbachii TaxID=996801 RepID=A0A1B8TW43_9FLAO|nr:mobile mystery protein A [Polaribacter reichenbachii]APZ45171.1 XRE family transcriptional regulator [Polaribacter reichenbachii]AUC19033.1 XRE family transcriptional regulator [Polaribacter reichenbachii]OBY63810.1 XRE family transcriptional regulator [Polaribacter reichenbachii]
MRNKNKLLIAQLDEKLILFKEAEKILVPSKGWINTIRTSLNMTREQLGMKLNLTKGGIQKIEEREATGQITLNKLKDAGRALNMKFIYGFVPEDGTIENLINLKAEKLARKIVLRTNQNMKLEDQAISEKKIEESINDLADELKREMSKSLWD